MSAKFGTFRHKVTGKVVSQPAHYGRLYPDLYEEVDASNLRCTDCGVPEAPEPVETEAFEAPVTEFVDLYEPEPVKRRRRKESA